MIKLMSNIMKKINFTDLMNKNDFCDFEMLSSTIKDSIEI